MCAEADGHPAGLLALLSQDEGGEAVLYDGAELGELAGRFGVFGDDESDVVGVGPEFLKVVEFGDFVEVGEEGGQISEVSEGLRELVSDDEGFAGPFAEDEDRMRAGSRLGRYMNRANRSPGSRLRFSRSSSWNPRRASRTACSLGRSATRSMVGPGRGALALRMLVEVDDPGL